MARKRGKFEVTGEIGRHYGRLDLDRVGFFDDQPPGPFDKYVKAAVSDARSDFKGKQLLAGQPNDYFDKTFKRLFDGETLQTRARKKLESDASGRPMLPPSPTKLHSTPNDWFGCIGKAPDYFSPEVKRPKETSRGRKMGSDVGGEPPNCKIKPNPIGGPGYVDICLNPYPKHSSEPYEYQEKDTKGKKPGKLSTTGKFLTASSPLDYFTPNPYLDPKPGPTYVPPVSKERTKLISGPFYVPFPKEQGGHHAGCFSKFPAYKSDLYQDRKREVGLATGQKFIGGGPPSRSKYTCSIVNQVTGISCNAKNYRDYRERVYPLEH